jgi:uncharacterized membrane protein
VQIGNVLRDGLGVNRKQLIVLVDIVFLALCMRLLTLNHEDLWFDEIMSVNSLHEASLPDAIARFRQDNPPLQPLYLILLYGWSKIAGLETYVLRSLSMVLGLIALVQTYFLGRTIRDHITGCIGALGIALSATHIYYAHEVRVYALNLCFILLSCQLLLLAMSKDSLRWWVAQILVTLLIAWTQIIAILVLIPQGLLMIYRFRDRPSRVVYWTVAQFALIGTLWFWWVGVDQSVFSSEVERSVMPSIWLSSGHTALVNSVIGCYFQATGYLSALTQVDSWTTLNGLTQLYRWGMLVVLFASLVGVLMLWICSRRNEDDSTPHRKTGLLFLLLLAVVPPFALYAFSHLTGTVFFPRYVLYSTVPLYLALGVMISAIPKDSVRTGAVWFVIVTTFIPFLGYWGQPNRRPWSAIDSHITENLDDKSIVRLFNTEDCGFYHSEFTFHSEIPGSRIACYHDLDRMVNEVIVGRRLPTAIIVVGSQAVTTELEINLEQYRIQYARRDFPSFTPISVYITR